MPKASNQRAKIDKMRLAEVLARLEGVRCEHGYYVAKCPCHDDRRASLSTREENGRLLLHCFAGCRFEAIIEALDVKRWHRPAGISGNYRKPRLDDAKRIEIARRIWRDTKPATGTIVETYLKIAGHHDSGPEGAALQGSDAPPEWRRRTGHGRGCPKT